MIYEINSSTSCEDIFCDTTRIKFDIKSAVSEIHYPIFSNISSYETEEKSKSDTENVYLQTAS